MSSWSAVAADHPRVGALAGRAAAAGLAVRAAAGWPESTQDGAPPALPGFVLSSFHPLVVAAAERCLLRVFPGPPVEPARGERVAVVLLSSLGDVASAVHVARAVDAGERVGPLLFFQAVPNAVLGHLAARWQLAGPVLCLSCGAEGLAAVAHLIGDGDADEALVVLVEPAGASDPDTAVALLVGAADG